MTTITVRGRHAMNTDALYWNVVDRNTGEVFLRGVSASEAETLRRQLPDKFKCMPSPDQEVLAPAARASITDGEG